MPETTVNIATCPMSTYINITHPSTFFPCSSYSIHLYVTLSLSAYDLLGIYLNLPSLFVGMFAHV